MPRSSFSDNPLLRVSRPVSACSRCRTAKCDGKLPACTACEKAGRENECSAANDQFARGKERSYVAALELRIEKLERRLAYARMRKDSVAMHDGEAAAPPVAEANRKDSLANIRAAIHRKAARRRENSDVNSLVSDFGYLSINATTRDFEPSVTNMTFARLVLAAATNDPLPEPINTKLPSQQAAYAIVQFYLTNIYPLYPAFTDTTLLALLDDIYKKDQRPVRSPEYWLFWMVLAIGSTAQSRSMQDDYYKHGVEFVSRALTHADRALRPGYITQIQSLALLTQYSMLDPAHFDSWHLIGFTCRAVIDLGFHQDPPPTHASAIDKAALEGRRRTFYCVYALDRAISMVHARAFSFTDDATGVALPSPGRPAAPIFSGGVITGPASTEASLHLFKLRRLQSYWYQTLFQCDPTDPLPDPGSFIWKMCFDMREWSENLPDALPVAIRDMFDLELRYSYVYCVAPSARALHMTDYGRLLIFEHAIAYINRICDVAHTPVNAAFYTYHDALRVYFMGSQFVAVLRDAADVLLSGSSIPMPLSLAGNAPPPPLPERFDRATSGDNLDRSLRLLEKVSLTLKKYGERWEDALSLMRSFEMMSAEVMADLKARRELRQIRQAEQQQQQQQHQLQPQGMQNPNLQQQQQQHQLQPQGMQNPNLQQQQRRPLPQQMPPQEVRWIDVDVTQMLRGGNQL
ncbi:fungal-specific transcription factor domain-containing protein [Apodospora peruviana]|uniref:Fungal-specific transcription factor domain-containing protein n=1 Tax=Apodospora peruviana TaxID=516989 RepID=A0AAE0I4E8_9PEZI|nr:fungal-specific transcription factor domain-containing protein [Apodospora peruviana]